MEPLLCYSTTRKTACTPSATKSLSIRAILLYLLLMLLPLLLCLSGQAQTPKPKSTSYTDLAPAEDHYSTLQKLPATRGNNDHLEEIAFPKKDFRRAEYLTLPLRYLTVPVDTFKIGPYPANSSAQTKAELGFLLRLQQQRTAADIAKTDGMANVYYDPLTLDPQQADYSRNIHSLFYVGRSLGPWFIPEQLPVTKQVLQQVIQDATFYIFSLKASYNRARPYQLEPLLQHLEEPGHASYPSGHSSASYVHAYLLSQLLPQHSEQLLSNAYDMAFSREIRGVHFPSDSEAGKVFARQFVDLLLKSERFREDYAAMQKELLDALQQHTLTSSEN